MAIGKLLIKYKNSFLRIKRVRLLIFGAFKTFPKNISLITEIIKIRCVLNFCTRQYLLLLFDMGYLYDVKMSILIKKDIVKFESITSYFAYCFNFLIFLVDLFTIKFSFF